MDTRLRDLERRASSGDTEALQTYIRECIRIGKVPAKFLRHNWESEKEFPARSDLDLSYYPDIDTDLWVIELENDRIETEYSKEDDVIEEIRNTLNVCMRCFFPSDVEYKCCHCTVEHYDNFDYCRNCKQVLCTADPCVLCLRLGYKEFPNAINGQVIEWHSNIHGVVCGMCMTYLRRSDRALAYHAEILDPYDQSPPLKKTFVTFRCSSCGLFPEPLGLKLQGTFDVYPRSLEDNPYRRNSDERRRQLERKLNSGDTTVWEELKALYARQSVEMLSCECRETHPWHVNFGVVKMCPQCGGEGGEYGYDEYGYNSPPVWFACYGCSETGKVVSADECPTFIIPLENSAQLRDGRMVCMRCAPEDTRQHLSYGYDYHHYEDMDGGIPPISPRCMCRLCFPNEIERLAEINHWERESRIEQARVAFYAEQELAEQEATELEEDIDIDDDDAVPF